VVDAEPRARTVELAKAEGDLVSREDHSVDLMFEVHDDVLGEAVVEPPRAGGTEDPPHEVEARLLRKVPHGTSAAADRAMRPARSER